MIKYCAKYSVKYKKELIAYLVLSIISTIIVIWLPIRSGQIVDYVTTGNKMSILVKKGMEILFLGIFNICICYWNNKLYIMIQTNSAMDISADVISHLHSISFQILQRYDAGYLNEGINHDSNSIIIFFLSMIVNVISNTIVLLITIPMIWLLSWKIAVVLSCLIIVYVLLFVCFRNKLLEKAEKYKEARSVFFSAVLEQFNNIKFIKQHALEELYSKKLQSNFKVFFKEALNTQQFFCLYSSIDNILDVLSNFCIYVLGGMNVIQGGITIGKLIIFLNFYQNIISAVKYFTNFGKEYQDNLVSYNRLQNYLNIPEQNNGANKVETIERICCRKLSFSREKHFVIKDFNVEFQKGKIYCIQGKNGSGKTTLIDLITGLYMGEYEGEILYNTYNIANINMKWMRKHKIAVLEQNPYILEGQAEDNIYLTDEHKKKNYYSRFIHQKIGKIGKNGEGTSGGERQKIGIVRTLAKDSEIIIFDEPISALDQQSRKEFYSFLQEIKNNKIIIIVSHEGEINRVVDMVINM